MSDDMERPEAMADFFDARAAGYDNHMRGYIFTETTFVQFYQAVAAPIAETDQPIRILDLGCGTGLEIETILRRAPNALITGVDVSSKMLDLLQKQYSAHMGQITLVMDSYLTRPFGTRVYDYVISVMTTHHLRHEAKRGLYQKIHAALKTGGHYIEGDSVTPAEMESRFLAEFDEQIAQMPHATDGHYHLDVPFSLDTQRTLLLEAGFKNFELIWQKDSTDLWNAAVYVVTA